MTDMQPDKIKPEHNPWYLLATLYGEALSADDEVHARNRMAWNRFMAAELTEDARAFLIKKGGFSAEELKPFSAEELSEVEKLFAERHQQATGETGTTEANLPFPNFKRDQINFSNVEFGRFFCVKSFLFPSRTVFSGAIFGWADFSGATFSRLADFSHAQFSGKALFSDATFSGVTSFLRARFSRRADFRSATFGHPDFPDSFGLADFSGAIFSRQADFSGARFSNQAYFRRARFSDQAGFSGATFSGRAGFSGVRFSGWAVFSGAKFLGRADFSRAQFSGRASFSGAAFSKDTLFVNAEMENPTWFEDANFSSEPPQFFGATLHEGTVWRGVPPWPLPLDQKEAGQSVDAYERLKLEMDRLKKHEDELDFFALELQSRRVLHGDWQPVSELKIPEKTITLRPRKVLGRSFALSPFTIKARTIRFSRPAPGLAIALYGQLSDYGRSYVRPLCGLLITVAAGIRFFWWHFGLFGFWRAVGLSFANTFGVFGFRKDLIDPQVLTCLPGWLKVVAASQTIVGIVLIFLFGLAIRNRFRMK